MTKAERIARRLLRANHVLKISWRSMSHGFFENTGIRIPHGTLSYFAKMRGAYIPQNEDYQIALGLRRKPQPPRRYTLPEQAERMPRLLDKLAKKIAKLQTKEENNHAGISRSQN